MGTMIAEMAAQLHVWLVGSTVPRAVRMIQTSAQPASQGTSNKAIHPAHALLATMRTVASPAARRAASPAR